MAKRKNPFTHGALVRKQRKMSYLNRVAAESNVTRDGALKLVCINLRAELREMGIELGISKRDWQKYLGSEKRMIGLYGQLKDMHEHPDRVRACGV